MAIKFQYLFLLSITLLGCANLKETKDDNSAFIKSFLQRKDSLLMNFNGIGIYHRGDLYMIHFQNSQVDIIPLNGFDIEKPDNLQVLLNYNNDSVRIKNVYYSKYINGKNIINDSTMLLKTIKDYCFDKLHELTKNSLQEITLEGSSSKFNKIFIFNDMSYLYFSKDSVIETNGSYENIFDKNNYIKIDSYWYYFPTN